MGGVVFDCLGGNTPLPPERNTAWYKGRKYFHCLGAPNNLIRPWVYRYNVEARSPNHCDSGEAICITYSEWVFVAVVMQDEQRMRHIAICDLSDCTIFFSKLSHKRHDFGGKVTEHKMRAWNKGGKCFHCLGAPNNLIRPWPGIDPGTSPLVAQCLNRYATPCKIL